MTHWIKGAALAAAIGVATSGAAAAPFVDLEASAGMTLPQLNSGGIGDGVSLTDDGSGTQLNLSAENGFYLAGRAGVPILPDVKLRYERLNFSNGDRAVQFNFAGRDFSTDGEINLDMSYIDTAFVYGIPNLAPGIDYFVDFGVNLRWLIGGVEAEIDGAGNRQEESFPVVPIPSGHLAAGATIPVVGVQLSGELNTLPLDGVNYNDWNVKARYFLPLPLDFVGKIGVEAGYRNWTVDIDGRDSALIDNDDLRLDFDTSGYFLGTSISF